ncbi:MAG: hypothetical protein GY930_20500 [bacterium]|nr:hypothetical protein [bacterium]
MKRTHVLLLLLAIAASCVTPAPSEDPTASEQEAALKARSEEMDSDKLAKEIEILQRGLDEARLAHELEGGNSDALLQKAQREVQKAEHAVVVARGKWAHFRDVESLLELSKSKLSVDRAVSRLEAQRQDLIGILAIYEGEEEALAKDEIIRRNRKSVEFAEKALEQARLAAQMVNEFVVPQKNEALQWALQMAEGEVLSAGANLDQVTGKVRLARMKAAHRVMDAESKLEDKRAQLKEQQDQKEPSQ